MAQRLANERRSKIAAELVKNGTVSALELAQKYGVSTETIRKDLLYLEARGVAEKSYGGAMVSSKALERPFLEKALDRPEEKKRIAQAVAKLVPANATVVLDSGSTVLEIARQLASRTDLTFFTNSLDTAQLLAEKRRQVYMLGGAVRLSSHAATGEWAWNMLSQLNADVAILGTSGFADGEGPCVESLEESGVKRAMIQAAKMAILAADSTKGRCSAPIRFARWQEIDTLVTDDDLDADMLAGLERCTRVCLVGRDVP